MTFDPNAAALPGSGIFGLPCTVKESRVVIVPVPFEATTSYGEGTAKAPRAILRASHQVDLYDHEAGKPYEAGIAMLPISRRIQRLNREAKKLARPIVERGGNIGKDPRLKMSRAMVNRICTSVRRYVEDTTRNLLSQGKIPVVLGGEHSVSFGAIKAYAEHYGEIGVLQIDAHADLREAFEGFTWSHASIMWNVAKHIKEVSCIVQVGIRDFSESEKAEIEKSDKRIISFFDADIALRLARGQSFLEIARRIVARLPRHVYVSFDIDGLNQSLCPHTGTPVPGGLSFSHATMLLDALVRSGGKKIIGFDLVEVAPGPKGDEWDANVGARLLYKLIGFTLLSQ